MLSPLLYSFPESFTVHVYADGSLRPVLVRGKANGSDAWIETHRVELLADGMLQPARWLPVSPRDLTPLLQGLPAEFEYVKTLSADALR